MANTNITAIMLVMVLGGACAFGGGGTLDQVRTPAAEIEGRLRGVTNVVFVEVGEEPDTNQWQHFSIKDPQTLERLLSPIKLTPKNYCQCEHRYEVIFESPSDTMHVSFCDHCFDVEDVRFGSYVMPKAFYEEFQKLARRHNWHEPSGWP